MIRDLLDAVFPLTCPGCGNPGEPVCTRCAELLRPPLASPPPRGVDAWFAPFAYEGVARELVARVKYRGLHATTGWLAQRMVMMAAPPLPAVVTWAPTTSSRRRARGFDHAELLAREVGRLVGRPTRRLLRRQPGRPQTGLAASQRRVGPSFTTPSPAPASVLLVDDVATTGATVAAAAASLRARGATRVVVLTAARTPPPSVDGARAVSCGEPAQPISPRRTLPGPWR